MKTMKTAMQELLDKFKEYESGTEFVEWLITDGKFIEIEKQQIIDAYNQGYRDGENADETSKALVGVSEFSDAELYYKETFELK
jgi:hypothetical protein